MNNQESIDRSKANRYTLIAALLVVASVFVAACRGPAVAEEPPVGSGDATPPLTEEALKNLTYRSEWTESGVAQLTDGEYRKPIMEGSATEMVIRLLDVALGDLDGDGVKDAAVILVTDPGGSGTFFDLIVVLNRDGKPEHVASASLGDRAQVQAFSVATGQIIIEMITHGPDDPMCCPSQRVKETYALLDGELVLDTSEVIGPDVSDDSDITGIEWQWLGLIETSPAAQSVVPDPENYTITFLPDGTLQIKADCNVVRGSYTQESGALTIELGPSTRAYCGEASLDLQYLELLASVSGYSLEDGQLAFHLKDGAGRMLLTEASPSASSGEIVDVEFQWIRFEDAAGENDLVVDDPGEYTLELRSDGTYHLKADCNLSSGGYVLDGETLTLLPGPTTLAECGPDSLYDEYLRNLDQVATFELDGDELVLNLEADAGRMIFSR